MINPSISLAGFLVGLVVGLTGMGGGALMTPVLVLLFGVEPLSAVSSDIVASLFMKPAGAGIHWRRGTVNWALVKWLVLGSVPAAFLGVAGLRHVQTGPALQASVKLALGIALFLVASVLALRPLFGAREAGKPMGPVVVRPLPTVIIGIVGGLVVGITSVGSGSLIIMMMLLLYPRLRLSALVGTDLAQAIPLVASAALAHLIFGEFHLGLTATILLGSIPGVCIGAQLSSRAPDQVIRPALMLVLMASALKLLGAGNGVVLVALLVLVALALTTGMWRRSPREQIARAPSPVEVALEAPAPEPSGPPTFPQASP